MSPLPRAMLAALLSLTLLAGCTETPPAAELQGMSHMPPVTGNATIVYRAASGQNPAGGLPQVGGAVECAQPDPASPFIPPCRPAYSDIRVNVTAPLAGTGTYSVYLINATGELLVAQLAESNVMGNTALYSGGQNFTEDLTGRFLFMELRLGSFLLGETAAQAGAQTFSVAAGVTPSVEGLAYEGRTLSGTASGLQPNATYKGHLYLPGANGGAMPDPAESFNIGADGAISYTSPTRNISDFAEFHIHVGDSKVNVYKATIPAPAE